ncbi:MAG: hypothetical protein WCL18_04765 [bacterium]
MNTIQRIMNIILRSMFNDVFKNGYTQEEIDLLERIKQTRSGVCMDRTRDGQTILCWISSSGQCVACPVDDQGIDFSGVQKYKARMFEMKGLVSEKCAQSEVDLVNEEIKIFKMIFRDYSIDAEACFK